MPTSEAARCPNSAAEVRLGGGGVRRNDGAIGHEAFCDHCHRWVPVVFRGVPDPLDPWITLENGERVQLATDVYHGLETHDEGATPDEWQERTGIRILDPDGWRGSMADVPWSQPITRAEFLRRAMHCTVGNWPIPLHDEATHAND